MSKDIQPKQNPLLGEPETDPKRQLVVSTLANHAEVETSDWRIHESSIISEILYLEEAYGFDLDSFLESRYFLEQEQIPREEVRDFLHSFIPFGYQHPVDDIDFESDQRSFVPIAIEDWEIMLDFAINGNQLIIKLDPDFQARGLKAGYSLHCLQQYPSGFSTREKWFPRAFICSDEGDLTFDEMRHFIEGLPTELDRKVGRILLEEAENKDFTSGKTESEWFAEGKSDFNFSTRNAYGFDGVTAFVESLDAPLQDDTFGVELHQIFRDYVSNLTDEELKGVINSFDDEMAETLQGFPDWAGFVEYGFVKVLSEKAEVPKNILEHYEEVFTECEEAYHNGDY